MILTPALVFGGTAALERVTATQGHVQVHALDGSAADQGRTALWHGNSSAASHLSWLHLWHGGVARCSASRTSCQPGPAKP